MKKPTKISQDKVDKSAAAIDKAYKALSSQEAKPRPMRSVDPTVGSKEDKQPRRRGKRPAMWRDMN